MDESMQEIIVVEIIKAISGKESELKKVLKEMIPICLLEEGCLQYDLFEPMIESGDFFVFMRWRDIKDLTKHESSNHIQDFIKKYDGILYDEVTQTEWKFT
jgi:quinol monooxygenase YgiN